MAYLATVCLLSLLSRSTAVTPVEKVVELLKKLSVQVQEEGKVEAANYDKYSCFCKETADGKLYAIETSKEKIDVLNAKMNELNGEINLLSASIQALGTKIDGLTSDISNATATRNIEHAAYLVQEKDMSDALAAIDGAIASLKASKAAMAGKTELEAAALLQAKSVAEKALALLGQPGEAYEYGYHSNDIIDLLKDLKIQFTKNKNDLDQTEFETNSAHEKRKLGMLNEKKFAEQEKSEKTEVVEKKTEAVKAAEVERDEENDAKEADEDFIHVLQEDCENKAKLWDQRSTTRAKELTALSEATEALESGVKPNWGANRKLVDLQKGHWEWVENKKAPPGKPASFLQLRGSRQQRRLSSVEMTEKIAHFLDDASKRVGSPLLSATVLKVKASEDHFVKVRSLIKDLVARLEMDKMNEATTKSYCDTSMKAAVDTRDATKENLEKLESEISLGESKAKKLEADIAALSAGVAANAKQLNEATVLRTEEAASNNKTILEAGAGKDAVELAINILRQFYDSQGVFLQKVGYEPYVAPNANREGKTVADLAPDVFDIDYKGKQEESKGVLGFLEVILSDFDRTETTVTKEEELSQADFEELESDLNIDTKAKNADIAQKTGALAETNDDLVKANDEKKGATELLDSTVSELEKLKKMCVEGEETYEERVAKRAKEIEALKEALQILDNWQS